VGLQLIGNHRRLKPTVNKVSSLAGLKTGITQLKDKKIPLIYYLTQHDQNENTPIRNWIDNAIRHGVVLFTLW
jgi:hypothetical protein